MVVRNHYVILCNVIFKILKPLDFKYELLKTRDRTKSYHIINQLWNYSFLKVILPIFLYLGDILIRGKQIQHRNLKIVNEMALAYPSPLETTKCSCCGTQSYLTHTHVSQPQEELHLNHPLPSSYFQ